MEQIFNVILKFVFLVLGTIISIYLGAFGFIMLISPDADILRIIDNSSLYINIALWTYKNWNFLSFTGSYVIVGGMPAIQYFLLKFILSPVITLLAYLLIIKKKWATIVAAELIKKKEKVHGDAKWATQSDIETAGLRAKDGMLLGKDAGGYFVADGFQHALLFAPTGSG